MRNMLVKEAGLSEEEVDRKVIGLNSRKEIAGVCRTDGGGSGARGYVNWLSGWADAEKAMRFIRGKVEEKGKVEFIVGEVVGMLKGAMGEGEEWGTQGVKLRDGREVKAELTILATGAWTPGLLDLSGRAVSTGQVVAYVEITKEEEEKYKDIPAILNLSSGMLSASVFTFFIYCHIY